MTNEGSVMPLTLFDLFVDGGTLLLEVDAGTDRPTSGRVFGTRDNPVLVYGRIVSTSLRVFVMTKDRGPREVSISGAAGLSYAYPGPVELGDGRYAIAALVDAGTHFERTVQMFCDP